MYIYSFLVVLLSVMPHAMGMETSMAEDFDKMYKCGGRKIHRLWRELEQGMFLFMMNKAYRLVAFDEKCHMQQGGREPRP